MNWYININPFFSPSLPELSSGSIQVAKDQQNRLYHEPEPPQNQQNSQNQQHSDPFQHQHPLLQNYSVSYNEVTSVDNGGGVVEATHINRGPFFDVTASRNVTALVGKTAYLNCRVHNLNNKTVRSLVVNHNM